MQLDSISHIKLNIKIAKLINKEMYNTIFVHHPNDINKDHQILFDSVMVDCRQQPKSSVT